jgi:hypothetical protein
MPIDLEKEIVEIKVKLGQISEQLKDINILGDVYDALEERVRKLEGWQNRAIGIGTAVAAIVSIVVSLVSKFL